MDELQRGGNDMDPQHETSAQLDDRAQRCRQPGVQYKLRVIEGSGGLLELVEQESPGRHWFMEWARAMQHSGWTL